ncbi:MAG: hypothetical protein JSR82_12220 [Verrucomicrobia bacterium]|nr:hypothetical protein [Verrucomicrobiota bacterium]
MISFRTALAALTLTATCAGPLAGQGSLAPDDEPSPSMKRLDQIEPRTDLARLPGDLTSLIVINNPGSYYLSSNLFGVGGKHGIRVNASDVTIDLRGFTLVGDATSLDAISCAGARVTILNGSATNWRFGVDLGANGTVEQVKVAQNRAGGFRTSLPAALRQCVAATNGGDGFELGPSATLTSCHAETNAGLGFRLGADAELLRCSSRANGTGGFSGPIVTASLTQCSSVSDAAGFVVGPNSRLRECTVRQCIATSISAAQDSTLIHCQVYGAETGTGIAGQDGCQYLHCSVSNAATGMQVTNASTLQACTVRNCPQGGIVAGDTCTLTNCVVRNCGVAGITVGANCTVSACTAQGGTLGIVASHGTIVERCSIQGTTSHGIQAATNCRLASNICRTAGGSGIVTEISCILTDNIVTGTVLAGIQAGNSSQVLGNMATFAGGAGNPQPGIFLNGFCRAENNYAAANTSYGIRSLGNAGFADVLMRNFSRGNSGGVGGAQTNANYFPYPNTFVGPIINPADAGQLPSANY